MKIITMTDFKLAPLAKQTGFTLIELMTTVAIISVVAAVAFPSFTAILKNRAISTAGGDVITGLQTARTEAITRSQRVKACFSATAPTTTTAAQCVSPASTRPDYLYVFIDTDNDDEYDITEDLIVASSKFNNKIVFNEGTSNTTGTYVEYNQRGKAAFESTGNSTAYFTICDDRAQDGVSRIISLSASGRASISVIKSGSPVGCT